VKIYLRCYGPTSAVVEILAFHAGGIEVFEYWLVELERAS
jgi:hypothetical protein